VVGTNLSIWFSIIKIDLYLVIESYFFLLVIILAGFNQNAFMVYMLQVYNYQYILVWKQKNNSNNPPLFGKYS